MFARRFLASTIAATAMASAFVVTPVLAQPTTEQSRQRWNIPAGSLEDALSTFAAAAGTPLSFEPTLVAGKHSNGLRGDYSVEEGFNRLLQGSGLERVRTDSGTYTLRAATQGAVTLAPVKVVAAGGVAQTAVKVEQATVTRSGATLLDTPQTVNVVTRELAQQQNAQTLGDVVRNVAGARTSTYFGTYDSITMRGFGLSNISSYLRNGFRFTNLTAVPQHNVERYEFLKGPASMDYGRTEPGGLINIVTKRPQAEAIADITIGVGEYEAHDIAIDLGGALNDSKTVQYRLTGGTTQQAFPTEEIAPRQDDLGGALSIHFSENTRLDLDAETSKREQLFYPGLPVPEPMNAKSADRLPIDAFYGEQSAGKFEGETEFLSARLNHRFNDDWSIDAGYARNYTMRFRRAAVMLGGLTSDGERVNRSVFASKQEFYNDTLQLELKGELDLLGMQHRLTVLADNSEYEQEYTLGGDGTIAPIDLYDPRQTGLTVEPLEPGDRIRNRDRGLSVQDYVTVTPWLNLLAGARYSEYKEISSTAPDQKGDNLDPTAGVIVKPREELSLYASLTRSSTPNVGTLTGPGQYADPSEAEQYEIGAKGEWFDHALRTSLALYELTKTNVPTAIAGSIYSELSGEVRARGWELEVVGQLTPAWNISATYADTDVEITEDNNASVVGNTPGNTPRHTGSLWTTYALDGIAQGWTVGGGVFYTGSKFVSTNNLVELPSNTIVDAMVSYQFDERLRGTRLQVNLRNVFDERAYDSGSSNGRGFTSVFPVLPRTLSLSLSVPLL